MLGQMINPKASTVMQGMTPPRSFVASFCQRDRLRLIVFPAVGSGVHVAGHLGTSKIELQTG